MPKNTSPKTVALYEKLAKLRKHKRGVGAYLREHFEHDKAHTILKKFNEIYSTSEATGRQAPVDCPDLLEIVETSPDPEPVGEEISLKVEGDQAVLVAKKTIRTEAELLAECKVDLTIWQVASCEVGKWDVGRKAIEKDMTYSHGVSDGHVRDTGKVNVEQLFRVVIKLKKRQGAEAAKEIVEFYREELAKAGSPDWSSVPAAEFPKTDEKYCLELAIPDVHLGKMCWALETGGSNYDSKEAIRLFKDAAYGLISKAPVASVEKILFVVGNDFMHVDNSQDQTSAGTYVGNDSRWTKLFMKGCSLLTGIVENLAQDREVVVVVVQGNHDFQSMFYLGEYLRAYFRGHANVTIDNSPTSRKYFRYGTTLIGLTHGDNEVSKNLPLIMATERSVDWSEVSCREWHCGHLHKESMNEFHGVKVRVLPALSGTDAWHAKKGYVGNVRGAMGFLYSHSKGLEASYYYNV